MTDRVQALLRAADPVAGVDPYDQAQTRAVLARATAVTSIPTPARHTGLRRLAATSLALVGMAGAFLLGQNVTTTPAASAAVEFARDGNDYIVTVTDPERDAADLTAALRDKGYDITIRTVPASPSGVGSLVEKDFAFGTRPLQALHDGPCLPGDQCTIGFRVPIDFHGTAGMVFGRPTRPGETYEVAASSLAPGERFACQDLLGKPVPEVVARLSASGVTVSYRGGADNPQDPAAYQAMYVRDLIAQSENKAVLFAEPLKPTPQVQPGC